MAKKLKVYRTSIGFFDLVVAAPSMKAAAEAWGSDQDIFKRGFAQQTEDPDVVAATTATPGIVLRRPVGTDGKFTEKATLPKAPKGAQQAPQVRAKAEGASKKPDAKATASAKAAVEKEKYRQDLERAKADAERERGKKMRERRIATADAAFERARSRHEAAVDSIRQLREEVDKDEAREDERWAREMQAHDDALKKTPG